MQQLLNLHPQPDISSNDFYLNLPKCPSNIPDIIVDWEKSFDKCVRELDNGSAPGPSGWTGSMGKILLRDNTCKRGLAALLQDIINGNLISEAKEFLLT